MKMKNENAKQSLPYLFLIKINSLVTILIEVTLFNNYIYIYCFK